MAIVTRAAGTAFVLCVLLGLQRVRLDVSRALFVPALVMGVLVAVQSYCLYSAVAIIPVALALLVFQTTPILFLLLSWTTAKEVPRWSSLPPMLLALAGLAVALNLRPGEWAAGLADIGLGATWAFAGAIAFALILYCNAYWVRAIDGRLRTLSMTAVAAVLVLVAGLAAGGLTPPRDGIGWTGIALLTLFYGAATTSLFVALPRLAGASSTTALNFEPIAVFALAWLFLGQTVAFLQILGAFITVSAIAWLTVGRK
jgi:drug/metabolite transporter (DMT)-like permease